MDINASSDNSSEEGICGQRWDPLGAPNDECLSDKLEEFEACSYSNQTKATQEKLQCLEEEQDILNSSLLALTSHFAQVQFRLYQVVNAPSEDKEELLKSLENFASQGIPDIGLVKEKIQEANLAQAVSLQRSQQRELIERLKSQLGELEQYAYENGESKPPQNVILERQRVILNELKTRMNLQIDEEHCHNMSPADVKKQINVAVEQFVNPLKLKEHLIAQLKTQVADLERFITYLQADTKQNKCSCGCAFHNVKATKSETIGVIERTAALLQMFVVLQQGCGVHPLKKNNLKNTMKHNHWGDLRAKLEMAILRVKDLYQQCEDKSLSSHGDYYSDSECHSLTYDVPLTTAVRKYLATSIRDLMQHGAVTNNNSSSIVPLISCFPRRASQTENQIHAWEIILEYYHLKNGETFNSAPARKLSQSFNLNINGASPNSNKQTMLLTIGSIISSHMPYKRSCDSHFKAFICAALNANKLVPWLNLIFQCRELVKSHYLPWSYVGKTGFQDALRSLDVLTNLKFDLPVDLAVRQFQSIKDVFT